MAAREVLARVEDLRQLAQLGEPAGLLRVGAISTALVSVVTQALRLMAERFPRVELKVTPGTSGHLYRMLELGELDCVLTPRPHFPLPKILLWREVRVEKLTLAAPAALAGGVIDTLLQASP